MDTFPFSLLVAGCLSVLVGVRFGLEAALPSLSDSIEVASSALESGPTMQMPPKPAGLSEPGNGEGAAAVLTPARCAAMATAIRDTCTQALARQIARSDPQEALRHCLDVGEEAMQFECRADVAETIAAAHRDDALAICAEIPSVKWRGQCHFGVGLALAEVDPEFAIARCDDAEAFRAFCRHDVVGEVSLVNLPAAVAICGREEGDALTRKTCWHGIGKYLARRDIREAGSACSQATTSWQGLCFHGVGWGAAERDVDAALSGCAEFSTFADNCRHGVANELKRTDPQREQAICESLQNSEARGKCLAFVTQ